MADGLPNSFKPLETQDTSDLPESFKPIEAEPSMLSKAWHMAADPLTDLPSRFAKSVADYIDQPVNRDDTYLSGVAARAKGFGAGAIQGIGDLMSGLTSPLNIATTAATMGSGAAVKAGLPGAARGLSLIGKGLSAPVVAHGAINLLDPESTMGERGQGLIEMAGGASAMMHTPGAKPKVAAAAEEVPRGPNTNPIHDPFATYREVPVGTKYTIPPEKMSRKKLADAIKLGFNYEGMTDDGKIIIKKIKESPKVQMPESTPAETNLLLDAANLPRTIMASEDLSAPLRQGLGLIHKKAFWTSIPQMVKALKSEDFYQQAQAAITDDPIFKKRVNARGQVLPSFAEQAGLKLTDLANMTSREESMMSQMAEKVPGVRASNRAYSLFLNKLRADTFKQMTTDFGAFSGIDVKNNLPLASEIADFINNASGRGDLGKLEGAAKGLSTVLFSPRLIASRLQMMGRGTAALFSPEVYMMSQPSVKREYLKSLFTIAAVGNTFTQLMRLGGGTVETDPASADFGKGRIGNTRIDPYGGFQQYIVAAQRLMPDIDLSSLGIGEGQLTGRMKSSTTEQEYSLSNPPFGRSNKADILGKFIRGKTNPIINFAWGLMAGQKEMSGKPMDLTTMNPMQNAIAQRFIPMLAQDIYDLIKTEQISGPAKVMAGALAGFGMGTQTYGPEEDEQ